MRSMSTAPAHRAKPRLTSRLMLAVALFAGACDVGNDPPPTDPDRKPTPSNMKDLSEVNGTVQAWPGEAEASCGARLAATRFYDDVGGRAAVETRVLLTTPEAYRQYFGHPAPAGVDLGKEWVVFYAPGARGNQGYAPDVGVVGVRGDVLHVVTSLTAPTPPCVPPPGMPMTTPGSGPTTMPPVADAPVSSGGGSSSSSGTGSGSSGNAGAPVPPPTNVAPPPMTVPPALPRPRQNFVLVKFPAQATHSVEFQHQDITPRCPDVPNPCAAVLCAVGQMCVVLESYPPRAQCVPQPAPDRCVSSASCPAGSRCSTERGDCQSCGRDPATACPAVCFGVCEPNNQVCTGGAIMGGCRSAEELKLEADKLCQSQNLVMTDFGTGAACFAGGFVEAKYTCCGKGLPPMPTPPVPTPSPTCDWSYAGGMGVCRSYDDWKREASDACQKNGRQLTNISTGARCAMGDSFTEVKFECCAVKR